jgi:hypothetical protein
VITLDDEPKTFAGIAWLRFNPDGLVAEARSYVQTTPGRQEPPASSNERPSKGS